MTQVEELRDIASDFSIYSRLPSAELAPGDLISSMKELVAAYYDAAPGGLRLAFESELETLRAKLETMGQGSDDQGSHDSFYA